jgi:hypothetical protein
MNSSTISVMLDGKSMSLLLVSMSILVLIDLKNWEQISRPI